jgi:glycosyltransferase involved in cell wall biosynthesis
MMFPPIRTEALSIGYLSPGWPPSAFTNGIVTSISFAMEGLERAGYYSHVLAFEVGDAEPGSSAKVAKIKQRPRSFPRWILGKLRRGAVPDYFGRAVALGILDGFRGLIDEHGVGLVEMEESFGWSKHVQEGLNVPLVVRLHGPWFLNGPCNGAREDERFRVRLRNEGRAIASAFAITSPSQDVLDRVRAFYDLPLPDAEVIPNPVSPCGSQDRWNPAECDPNLILFIGRFDRHKGGDVIIDAFDRVLARFPAARLQFVGPDRGIVDESGKAWSIAEYIRARAPEGSAAGRVEYLGPLPHTSLAGLRRKAGVVVVCSRYDNFPTTLLEAKSQGCPVVATEVGGIPEIVRRDEDGLLCRPGSADALADALVRLLADRPLAERLGRQARLDCESRYHPGVVAARLIEYYHNVLIRWERRERDKHR